MHGFSRMATAVALALALGTPVDSSAQTSTSRDAVTALVGEAAAAADLGEQMQAYYQAAVVGTRAFRQQFDGPRDRPGMRGFIVVPGAGGALDTIFFGDYSAGLVEVARYSVRGSSVVSSEYYRPSERPALGRAAMRLARARQTALSAYGSRDREWCGASGNANTVVLPANNGGAVVYVMSPPEEPGVYPLGANLRFDVDGAGRITSEQQLTADCYTLPRSGGSSNLLINHRTDTVPSEMHFFVSRQVAQPLTVVTANGVGWTITRGTLTDMQQMGQR